MSNTLVVEIDGIDQVSGQTLDATQLELEPVGQGVYGTALIHCRTQEGSGDLMYPMGARVRIYEIDNAAFPNIYQWYWFDGTLAGRDTAPDGAEYNYTFACQDHNPQLDRLQVEDTILGTTAATTFKQQVGEMVGKVQTGGATDTIDANSRVPDITFPATFGHQSWQFAPLRQVLDDLMTTARTADPAVRPAYYLGPPIQPAGGDAVYGPLTLWIYNAAVLGSPVYAYNVTPTGAERPIIGPFSRREDGTAFGNRQIVVGAGVFGVYEDVTGDPVNPYSATGAFSLPIITDTTLTVQADVDARAQAEVVAHKPALDSLEWIVWDRVTPGMWVSIINPRMGWPTPHIVQVVSSRVSWQGSGGFTPYQVQCRITVSDRKPELGSGP